MPLDENDLEESFSRASGPGGQNVNKVSTKVQLTHVPTGLTVTEQGSRSQQTNRQVARERLEALISEKENEEKQKAVEATELARRRNSPKPRKLKRRILESKKRRSQLKKLRNKIRSSKQDD